MEMGWDGEIFMGMGWGWGWCPRPCHSTSHTTDLAGTWIRHACRRRPVPRRVETGLLQEVAVLEQVVDFRQVVRTHRRTPTTVAVNISPTDTVYCYCYRPHLLLLQLKLQTETAAKIRGLGGLTPWKYVGGGTVCFALPKNVTFFHSKLLLDNSASHHQWKTWSKMEGKVIFRGAWNSLMAWTDCPPPHILRQIYATADKPA